MLKLVEIAKAWIAAENPDALQKSVSEYRIKVCDGCEHKKHLKQFDTYICELCNCPLSKKIFSPLDGPEACPAQKWKY